MQYAPNQLPHRTPTYMWVLLYCNKHLKKLKEIYRVLGQQMCLFLKKWFKTSQCPESFSSYMFSLMVIFHLQRQSYLPAVFVLQHCVDPSCIGRKF